MKKTFLKIISLMLVVVLCLSCTVYAYADEEATTLPSTTQENTTLEAVNDSLTEEASTTVESVSIDEVDEITTENPTVEEATISAEQAQQSLEEQKQSLEEKLKANEEKLNQFSDEAKECEEYINALDEKIGYINEELTILDKEVNSAKKKADGLKKQIDALNEEMALLQAECDEARRKLEELNKKFKTTYNAYCLRLRAMYISGSTSIIATLITSRDLSQFFNRYEMIKAIAKSDTQLLKEVNERIEKITVEQDGLNQKSAELNEKKESLDVKQEQYLNELAKIESKQKQIASKKITLSQDRAESDSLLAKYTSKTAMYTEFRNEDEELIKAVNQEISDLINGLKDPVEVTTVDENSVEVSQTVNSESTDGELYANSNAVLNLTYPTPNHYAVSQAFGHYRNGRPHTGIDFPLPTGCRVVASQKGIVITVKRLNYSYGYYVMIYHGTDAKGRKVVTLYAHNSSILVSVGQTVKKGQTIAKSGSTGNSTGPHCHFELIIGGTKTNPKNYLSK